MSQLKLIFACRILSEQEVTQWHHCRQEPEGKVVNWEEADMRVEGRSIYFYTVLYCTVLCCTVLYLVDWSIFWVGGLESPLSL